MNIKLFLKPFILTLSFIQICFAQNEITIIPNLEYPDSISNWIIDGSGSWKITHGELILHKAGIPSGPIRKPSALAILNSKQFIDVTIEADLKSTSDTAVIRRDLDIVFSYLSPKQFYYIHLAGTADSVHNGIFIVNNSNRKRIDSGEGKPQLKDLDWHHVKAIRNGDNGKIEVYVDNSKTPVLSADDKTLCCGQVGVGSFDDTGIFKKIRVSGRLK